jgi:hypothetical protein
MSHPKPFHRNYRAIVRGPNSGYSDWAYIVDREYSESPEHYVRAFLLIQSDLQRLFEYVEPSDVNLATYSYRIHELLMRTCIEVGANFKAILSENIFNPRDRNGIAIPENRWSMNQYKIVNQTHHLSSYRIHVPIWEGANSVFQPFAQLGLPVGLSWYHAYNKSKHDRRTQFKEANLGNLVDAVAGLLVLLSSQFRTEDFSTEATLRSVATDRYYSSTPALGGFLHIEFPSDWSAEEKYEFDWSTLKTRPDRFDKIDYDNL